MITYSRTTLFAVTFGLSALFSLGACGGDDYGPGPSGSAAITLRQSNGVSYLADGEGRTLYYFAKDVPGQSSCQGACLAKWPAFFVEEISVGDGLSAGDFAAITRADGSKQTTYKGWPLYYFASDKTAGDLKGQGVGGTWYLLPGSGYTVMKRNAADAGDYLVDASGRALYTFTKDQQGDAQHPAVSACDAGCIAKWPAFYVDKIDAPEGIDAADFAAITRADGSKQTTYKGWPLYTFADDEAGAMLGDGVGAVWYVASTKAD